jgi:tRNA pseudouridine38-40 synthase
MSVVRLDLAYNGAGFAGWATQPGQRTVQGELEAGLLKVLGRECPMTVAGRTDAGVHAWAQVASFEAGPIQPDRIVTLARALNGVTEADVSVISAAVAPEGFDARRSARSRTYCYRVLAGPVPSPFERALSLFWPHRVYPGLLSQCAEALAGTHDFTAFTPTQTEHVRFERNVFRAEWRRGRAFGLDPRRGDGEMLEFWIEADAFMRSMVRILVGTMLEVASGRRQIEDFKRLLGGAPREEAGDTARAHGLYLAAVSYKDRDRGPT